MKPLPIDRSLAEIVARVRESRAVVIVAPPGAGKTTRVPPAILEAGLLNPAYPNLVMLQPRRVAARASAERIAEENRWTLGREVGYHVRFDRRITPDTRLRVLTEGILSRQLLDDPYLEGVGCVILDEFHERSIHSDICLALLREIQQTVRNDLILIVMSATLEAEPVAQFLGGCPIVRTAGAMHEVTIEHAGQSQAPVWERAADSVENVLKNNAGNAGDLLVFLPGVEEIRRTGDRLRAFAEQQQQLSVLPLHGSLPPNEQMQALRPSDRRKIILSTNIAETSLTIDGVRTVIDSGLARVAGYDADRGMDRLELQRISKASAAQRTGRAGRTAPGRCVRLWSVSQEQAMADYQTPEICRVDLAATVLMLHAWGTADPRHFGWYERPPERMISSAERLLAMLGALTSEENGRITVLGERIMGLPVHPRLARLLIGAIEHGETERGAALAALLSEKDIALEDMQTPRHLRQPKTVGKSDLLVRLELLETAERAGFSWNLRDDGIDPTAARQAAKVRDDLLRIAERAGREFNRKAISNTEQEDETIMKLALLAYPDRVCRRRSSDPAAAAIVGGGAVRLAAESIVRHHDFFVAVDARQDPRSTVREALVRIASGIEAQWLEELFPQSIRRVTSLEMDETRGRVVGRTAVLYRDLPLRESADATVDPTAAGYVLAAFVRPRASDIFSADDAASSLLARVSLLRKEMPEHPWPAFDDAELADLLVQAAAGKRSLEEMKRTPLAQLLKDHLPYPLDRLLDQHAPESIKVPSGNQIRLEYGAGAPRLAVRLQEVFGWTDTPRIAGGRVPVLLHLLGPNFRPVQITDDLRSFWSATYFQVRKDLKVRYPKHAWPDEPLAAAPEAKGSRRS